MAKQKVHAVVGTGTASPKAILAALNDALSEGDALAVVWAGAPDEGTAMDVVYDHIRRNDIEFLMYHEDGTNPPRLFRESETGVVQKVRNAVKSAVESVANGGAVLFLWDDDKDDDQVIPVFNWKADGVEVKELTNGLCPITDTADIPEPQEPEVEKDPEEPEDDTKFTKDELETMTALAVKRYGARLGCKAATKSGIIEELFPSDEDVPANAPDPVEDEEDPTEGTPAVDLDVVLSDTSHPIYRSLTNVKPTADAMVGIERLRETAKKLADDILEYARTSREQSLALTHLEETVMWAVKAIVLQNEQSA